MPNFTFETDTAKSAAPLNWYVTPANVAGGAPFGESSC
jgi:hypothetical protein